jgi:hypothetical protein
VTQDALPPCGLYRTVARIGEIDVGRLVYFHNHGSPGPGLYLPERWAHNRATFSPKGMTVPADFDGRALRALPAEGFYRVTEAFFCCEKRCVRYEPDAFLQLGYNGAGRALVFVPELGSGAIAIPERGTLIDDAALDNLVALQVSERREDPALSLPRGMVLH